MVISRIGGVQVPTGVDEELDLTAEGFDFGEQSTELTLGDGKTKVTVLPESSNLFISLLTLGDGKTKVTVLPESSKLFISLLTLGDGKTKVTVLPESSNLLVFQ
jgi:hypothetical protein